MSLNVALIAGGMYERLYQRIPAFEHEAGVRVEVRFTGTHPELNAHLAGFSEPPYDLVSTHTKYAPSQQHLLAPLEGYETADFFPALLELARIGGVLYGLPRNIDLRLLHYRADLMDAPPRTWDELAFVAPGLSRAPGLYGFVLTGMESGLFGTFFELAESAGARIFPQSLVAAVNNPAGKWALGLLRELYAGGSIPPEVTGWHYDEVHNYFRAGRAAMVADWPGYYGSYCEPSSPIRDRFRVARMPAGPSGRVCCYAGSHTFALTHRGAARADARDLLRFLTAPEQQAVEADQGAVPVRQSLMQARLRDATGADAHRLTLLQEAIATDLIIPPKLPCYPEIEDILWRSVRAAMTGELGIPEALAEIEHRIAERVAQAVSV